MRSFKKMDGIIAFLTLRMCYLRYYSTDFEQNL
jgi:hypothetical protein